MPATTDALILLYVDTANIPKPAPSDPADNSILEHVFLASNNTDPNTPPESPSAPSGKTTFKTDLKSNSQIAWVGAVQDISNQQNDYVLINSITLNNDNIGIILRDKFGGKNPNQAGSGDTHIDGIVRNNPGPAGSETTYTINFSVCHNGTVTDGYQIDPKMRMT